MGKSIRKKPVALVTHEGETLTFAQWSERLGEKLTTLYSRISRGHPLVLPPERVKPYNQGVADANKLRTKHGGTSGPKIDPVYQVYRGMINRCENPNSKHYDCYGGRGITVYPLWRQDFAAFRDYLGPRPEGMTLERIDNNGNYEPNNVRWATMKEQGNNRRNTNQITHEGRTMSLQQWADELGCKYGLLSSRWKNGLRGEELFAPPKWERNKVYEYQGQHKTLAQWAKETGISYSTLVWRVRNNKPLL
jgi:hypothetical protein